MRYQMIWDGALSGTSIQIIKVLMIKQITDHDFIRSFLFDDPELYDRISDDNTAELMPDKGLFDPSNSTWFGFFEDDTCKAIISATPETTITLNIHISVPKKHREGQSFKMCTEILKYIEGSCDKRYTKINAVVPIIYKDVSKFMIKLGFNMWGIERDSFLKNGSFHDRLHFTKRIEV